MTDTLNSNSGRLPPYGKEWHPNPPTAGDTDDRSNANTAVREFFEICDWDSFQYSDTRKVPLPPWRWFKVPLAFVRSPTWMEMTRQQRGDFVGVLAAASQCGNLIPLDPKWLRSFGVSAKILKNLSQLGLIRIFSMRSDDKRIRDLRQTFSGGTPAQRRGEEHREEKNSGAETEPSIEPQPPSMPDDGREASRHANGNAEGGLPPDDEKIETPSPPRATEAINKGENSPTTENRKRMDTRSFDALKRAVLAVAKKIGTNDVALLHRFAGQSLRMSERQIAVAVRQLIEDRELRTGHFKQD